MTKPKELLIICDAFPPNFAPRMGYLCKNLENTNWNITVFCDKTCEKHFNISTGNADLRAFSFIRNSNSKIARLEWLFKFVLRLLFDYKNKWLSHKIDKFSGDKKFDLILCSTSETFPIPAALTQAKKRNIPLIVDIRDIDEQCDMKIYRIHQLPKLGILWDCIYNWTEHCQIKRRNKVIRAADTITTISPWHQAFLSKMNSNVELIYNGYDDESMKSQPQKTDFFEITYTGRVVDLEHRSPVLLFEAVKELVNEGYRKIKIKWYTDSNSKEKLQPLIADYGLNDVNEIIDMANATEIPSILSHAAICLVLTNKTGDKGPHGIMTTKFFEALGCERPILCVRSDEEVLEQAIINTNAGVAARTVQQAKDFIISKYKEWETNGYTTQDVRNKEIFSRRYQAGQFLSIFNKLTDLQ